MAKKKTVLSDSFEQVVELGQGAAKKTAKSVKNIVQDVASAKSLEKVVVAEGEAAQEKTNGQNHTPLNIDHLNQKYQEQDKQKEAALKVRLFQLSRQEEEKVNVQRKQKEQQKKTFELSEEEEKKKKEEERKKQQEEGALPRGKQRRSIFSPKKKASEQHPEIRPATGKQ